MREYLIPCPNGCKDHCKDCANFSDEKERIYQQGRADAIDECKVLFRKYLITKEIDGLDKLLEQLKEKKE